MKIVIETDGSGLGTSIFFNGIKQEKVAEFSLTAMATRNLKVQMVREIEGIMTPISLFAGDFKKFDEYNKGGN